MIQNGHRGQMGIGVNGHRGLGIGVWASGSWASVGIGVGGHRGQTDLEFFVE